MQQFRFDAVPFPPEAEAMRSRVRAFLAQERATARFDPHRTSWVTWDAEFSRRTGAAGFIGMTWPKRYGGGERSELERFVVQEEMLAASAPCFAHWVADRQSGQQILLFGSETARRTYLPAIAAGECFSGIGMSEPDVGSDLASVRTQARRTTGGWLLNGTKIWTSNIHRAHFILALVRSEPRGEDRHAGLTQFIVDAKAPGLTARPILNLAGTHEFNEVVFQDVFIPDEMVLGEPGHGWSVVTSELGYERAGPDRFMSDFSLLVELIDRVGPDPDDRQAVEIGRLVIHLQALRRMSTSVAGRLAKGVPVALEGTLVKDVGTNFEQDLPEVARRIAPAEASLDEPDDRYARTLADVMLYAPAYTLRGGTREILRGVIARGLGLR
jgi:alkylation response protein AidB-like acyl-CoA dehydrogenase